LDIVIQRREIDGLMNDELQEIASRVSAGDVLIEAEELGAFVRVLRDAEKTVSSRNEVEERLEGNGPEDARFKFYVDCPFTGSKGHFHLAPFRSELLERKVVNAIVEKWERRK